MRNKRGGNNRKASGRTVVMTHGHEQKVVPVIATKGSGCTRRGRIEGETSSVVRVLGEGCIG